MSTNPEIVTLTLDLTIAQASAVLALLAGSGVDVVQAAPPTPKPSALKSVPAEAPAETPPAKQRKKRTPAESPSAQTVVDDDPMPDWGENDPAPSTKPKSVASKGSVAAPVDTTAGEDGTDEQDEAQDEQETVAEVASNIPESLKTAEKAREVFGKLIEMGHNTPDKLKAICREWQQGIPFLAKFGDNLDNRVDSACDVLFR